MNYKFSCGCKFKQLDTVVKDCDKLPPLEIDYYNLPECSEVWPLLGSGKTKGVFQLEKSLGKHWCKELYPENIHHLAALASILRPGILESIVDDKSLTQHYCDNKNNRQEVIPMHPALEKILEDTQQIIIFQEQILLIAKEIAGFTGVEADTLRRGIGHKDAKVVFEMEKKFIDGCIKVGKINEQDAKNVFDIIKKSARYSFNASITEKCLINTNNGIIKSIKDIKIGELVETPNGFVKVVNWYDHGKQLVYGVQTDSGSYIEATLEHKFLCSDGIVRQLEDILDNKHKVVTKFGNKELFISDYLGFRQTYDIEIDSDDHIFWGNDIATSNSHAYAYGTIGYWTAYSKCLSEDTIVETKDGNKKIKNILINEYVKAPSENGDEFVLVTDKINQGIQEMYEITLESGKTIECTMNHKFLCEDGIIRELKEIIECDHKIQTQS